jgi:hypothetical protein
MNNYITLDGFKYMTVHKAWKPVPKKPSTVRYTLLGKANVTYGPASPLEWQGTVIALPATRDTWGSYEDLMDSLSKREGLVFYDHHGDSYTVHAVGETGFDSMSPVWDGASNKTLLTVRLVAE